MMNLKESYENFKKQLGLDSVEDEKVDILLRDAYMFGATSVLSYMTEEVSEMSESEAVNAVNNLTVQVSEYWADAEVNMERDSNTIYNS